MANKEPKKEADSASVLVRLSPDLAKALGEFSTGYMSQAEAARAILSLYFREHGYLTSPERART